MVNYLKVLNQILDHAHRCGRTTDSLDIIAVSKNHPIEILQQAYQQGCHIFGENRVQEALEKIPQLDNCSWHLIGSLQKNKVVKAVSHFALIHSVDSLELAKNISVISQQSKVITPILLQLNLSGEKTKHGFTEQELDAQLLTLLELPALQLQGLMTIAPLTSDQKLIRSNFSRLRQCLEHWKPYVKQPQLFKHLSMGMSNDYLIAIEEGATLLRIGTAIFGTRTRL